MIILRRRAVPRAAAVSAPPPAVEPPARRRGWDNLQGEVVGEMSRLGVNPLPVAYTSERYDGTVAR